MESSSDSSGEISVVDNRARSLGLLDISIFETSGESSAEEREEREAHLKFLDLAGKRFRLKELESTTLFFGNRYP